MRSLSLKELSSIPFAPGVILAFDGATDRAEPLIIRIAQSIAKRTGLTHRVFHADERNLFEQTRSAILFNRYCFTLINYKNIPEAGEHIIIASERSSRAHYLLSLNKTVHEDDFAAITLFLYPEITREQLTLLPTIRKMRDGLRIDYVSLFIDYQRIIGKAAPLFIKSWLEKIVPTEKRLFSLGESLLAGNLRESLIQWHIHAELYGPEFWTVYLSDLFWNSALYTTTAQTMGVAAAKELNLRLPFSFMQSGYKKFSLKRSARNLALIAETDSLLKRGASITLLDRCIYHCSL